jgi:hypothetical protein
MAIRFYGVVGLAGLLLSHHSDQFAVTRQHDGR